MKGFCSFIFVLLGIVNLIYCLINKIDGKIFPMLIVSGLIFGMIADVVLSFNFITGAAIFALGHVLYFAAFTMLHKFETKDLIAVFSILAFSVIIILLPIYDFGSKLMFFVIIAYAVIISLMLSKALMNAINTKKTMEIILFIGSLLFYVSDFMLLLSIFSGEKNFSLGFFIGVLQLVLQELKVPAFKGILTGAAPDIHRRNGAVAQNQIGELRT